jgi:cytochrome P450
MWYISGNRDEEIIPNGDAFEIERSNVRWHLSFGSAFIAASAIVWLSWNSRSSGKRS